MNYEEHRDRAALVRGTIINEVIFLERIMDIYIAQYFCSDINKIREMELLILGNERIEYGKKKQVFYILLQKLNPEIVRIKPKIDKELDTIGQERNFLAHTLMANPYPGIIGDKTTVYFSKLKNKYKSESFDINRFETLLNEVDSMIKLLQPLIQPPKENPVATE